MTNQDKVQGHLTDDQVMDQIVFRYGYKAPDWRILLNLYGIAIDYHTPGKGCSRPDAKGVSYPCRGHYGMSHMRLLLKAIKDADQLIWDKL